MNKKPSNGWRGDGREMVVKSNILSCKWEIVMGFSKGRMSSIWETACSLSGKQHFWGENACILPSESLI